MIPKRIHYCWFGHNPKPELARMCIASWKKQCPKYEIIEWNEDNFDISICPLYVRQAYKAQRWAFVSDYVRLKVVYDYGGIYLDTDVELKKRLDPYLEYSAYFGFEDGRAVATGLGFGAECGNPVVKEMMDVYKDVPFLLDDGGYDMTPCPKRNTEVLLKHGLVQDDSWQIIDGNVLILPSRYLCPFQYSPEWIGDNKLSEDAVSIHWFSASWKSATETDKLFLAMKQKWKKEKLDWLIHIPNRMLKAMLGDSAYDALKRWLKS